MSNHNSKALRLAIVEDNEEHAQALEALLQAWGQTHEISIQVHRFEDGYDIAEHYTSNWDVVFLDIEMRLMDGLEAAEKIRSMDGQVILIFTTSNPRYAISGYRVQALDYMLKPVTIDALTDTMRRCLKQLSLHKEDTAIQISRRDGVIRLTASEILYIESQGHRLFFHTKNGSTHETTSTTLSDVEQLLSSSGFMRCSSGCLVNLGSIGKVSGTEIKIGDVALPLSRSRRAALLLAISNQTV